MAIKAVLTPMLIAALGTILSLLGVYAVRVKRGASQTELMAALNRGINLSSFLIAIASAFLLQLIGLDNWAGIWGRDRDRPGGGHHHRKEHGALHLS